MNNFFKQIYRYTRPRVYRHNENLWPFCRILRANTGEIISLIYRNKFVPLLSITELHYKFSGDVLIIATGSSIKELDFTKIPTMKVIGVNGAYMIKNHIDFQFYIIVDMSFIDQRLDIIAKIIADYTLTVFTTLHGIIRIIDRFAQNSICCKLVLIEDACFRIYKPQISNKNLIQHFSKDERVLFSSSNPTIAFSKDIRIGIFDAGTVIFWALQILLFLGFNQIFIAGLDMVNFNNPRFYENEQNKLPSFLESKLKKIIIPAFTLASKVMKQYGIKVKNLSMISSINNEIFTKVNLHDAFPNELLYKNII